MRKLIGPHLAGQWAQKLDLLRQWQPPLVLLLSPDADKVAQLRAACPNTVIVGRMYHDDSHYAHHISTRPDEFAQEMHGEIMGNPATPLLDYVQTNNEVCQDWAGIQQLNKYAARLMALADEAAAYKCAILAFSVGNPDLPDKPGDPAGFDGRMLYWQQVLPSLNYAQRNGHLLLLHAYGYPDMFHPDADWYIYRYERQVQNNLRTLGIASLRYAYGEIGIDRLIVGDKGGYKVVTTDQDYTNQLLQWERDQQGQALLVGGAVYTFGDSGGWDTYDITSTGVASMLATHYQDNAGDYMSDPKRGDKTGDKTGTKISTKNGTKNTVHIPFVGTGTPTAPALERDISADFKRRVDSIGYVRPTPGQRYYALVEAGYYPPPQGAQKYGPDHHILVDVVGLDGKRKLGETVTFFTMDGKKPKPIDKPNEVYGVDQDMYQVGYAWGCWAGTKSDDSDSVWGMGLGTIEDRYHGHHVTYFLKFQEVIAPAADAPPPDTGTEQPRVPLLHFPLGSADYAVSQPFGANPQNYAKFGMVGHNGIDFAVPEGTSVYAVESGTVAEVRDDPDGYGKYVKIRHAWGESLYAHLRGQGVNEGNPIGKGDFVGVSGNTGNSTGPHLHFGLRVNPYTRGYPYDGYVDPAPFLMATRPDDSLPTPLQAIKWAAMEFGLEWQLLASQAWAESSFDPQAVSSAGAKGLMQIADATWAEWGPKVGASDPFNALDSARVGAAYTRWLLQQTDGMIYRALAAYAWGIGNVQNAPHGGLSWPDDVHTYTEKIVHGRDLLKAVGA